MFDLLEQVYQQMDWIVEQSSNLPRVQRYWELGECLSQWQLQNEHALLSNLANRLREERKWQISPAILRQMCRLYQAFPQGVQARLSWTHYCILSRLKEVKRLRFYENAALKSTWTSRELQRQIRAKAYEQAHSKLPLKVEYDFNFLGAIAEKTSEYHLEMQLAKHLPDFLRELGYGFSFVARQQSVPTESGRRLRVDWVFYHWLRHCFVLVDLKVKPLQHQNIGQLDNYVRLFDAQWRRPKHAPTLGLLLCPELDAALMQHSVLAESAQLWAAKYSLLS